MPEDELDYDQSEDSPEKKDSYTDPAPYRVFEDSRIPVSKAVGKMWEQKINLAIRANELVYTTWEEVLRYYNNDQQGGNSDTPAGQFHRGDGTENVIFSNVNTLIAAAYGRDPDVTCDAPDAADDAFRKSMQALLNTLIRRKAAPGIALKSKARRMALYGELTNFGVLKLDYQLKAESADEVQEQLIACGQAMAKAKTQQELDEIYGKLQGLEEALVVSRPSGPIVNHVLGHNLIPDPLAMDADGLDGGWMAERTWLPTEFLNARYTQKKEGGERMLIYKPTHKLDFKSKAGEGEDENFIGMLSSLGNSEQRIDLPTSFTSEERLAYIDRYMTEVFYVWDKITRRVFLFAASDWTWPVWVWDDPLQLSRFFPYFIFNTSLGTSGTVTVGETAYYLDQQDEINEINRELSRIRRIVFRFMIYNSNTLDSDNAQKLARMLSGDRSTTDLLFGMDIPEGQTLKDVLQAVTPPSIQYEALFNKAPAYATIDRVSGANDALRGTQFKANTTEDAVQAYMAGARIRVGARTEALEDTLSELLQSLSEVCVQFMDKSTVANLIGASKAAGWQQMSVTAFNATYGVNVVAGSTERPTSAYKKKESVQVAQAIGQFAAGAPVSTFKIAIRVLQKAFPGDVVINSEDWDAIDREFELNMRRGVSDGGPSETQQPGAPAPEQNPLQEMNNGPA